MTQEQKETLIRATTTYGCLNQCDMVIEECAELIQAINKAKRSGLIQEKEIVKPGYSSTNEECLAYGNLCGEVADVEIILAQLRSMLDGETIDLIKERKLERLKNRIEDKK